MWSIALMHEGRDVAAAFCFAVLLNMKHLFAALAPLYFVYLLSRCCRYVFQALVAVKMNNTSML